MLLTVGSDHHPFDRLVGWFDEWLGDELRTSPGSVDAVVQYGTAAEPTHGRTVAYFPHDVLQEELRRADVVVTQGGPMGIVEARRHGIVPIVVPRLRRLGEVVDDHQVPFCRQLAASHDVVLAETAEELRWALHRALSDPQSTPLEAGSTDDQVAATVKRFGELVAGLPRRRPLAQRVQASWRQVRRQVPRS